MESQARVALTFAIYQGDELVRRETVTQSIVKIGKDPRSQLRVDDDLASRMHAVIEVASPSDITIIDLGNEPGTMVNGQRVDTCKVHPGDRIQIGSTVIRLESVRFASAPELAPNPFVAAPAVSPFAPVNPFIASAVESYGERINAPGGSDFDPNQPYTYVMMKSGPEVRPEEVETHAAAVEVVIKWDTNTLHVSHQNPPKGFYVGEERSHVVGKMQLGCDYFVPSEVLGVTRAPIVVARGIAVVVIMLPRSTGTVEIPGQGTVTFDELIASGRAGSSSELSGAHEFVLPNNAKARMELASLVFEVSAVNAGKALPASGFSSLEPAAALFFSLSFLLHVGIVASMAFFMPKMGGDDTEAITRDQSLFIQKMLNASAEREKEEKQIEQQAGTAGQQGGGPAGASAQDEEGSMGNPNSLARNGRYGVQGPKDNPDPHLARQAAQREALDFGMLGLLNTGGGGDPKAPTSPWGREDSSGNDPRSALGNMWGDTIDESFGTGGLGLSGPGLGGGGTSENIGLEKIGPDVWGGGNCVGPGCKRNFGPGRGPGGIGIGRDPGARSPHVAKPPTLTMQDAQVSGRLPADVIQRIVRQNFGRFRACYENALRTNPNLSGRVTVKFVVDRSGGVSMAQDGGSDLADQGVVSCVVRSFTNLSFPQPEGSIVTVIYPIMFTPGD
ncbi:MAG: AgmX/PglI C-terminal domain-containing protein [Polyangiaceae bacterium]|nr:AgmX/PglI C-terminal domain-containing protein [Polyangiaceae bacterium]